MSSEVSSRRLVAAVVLLALAFTSLTQIGCTRPIRRLGILDELAIQYRDRVWAQRAYNLRFANCNREYTDHFKSGFCAGYSDICNGGDGYLPALPPEQYRGFEYQCAEGSKCVESWFEGYPAGVAAAREEKAGNFHEMHVSQMIDRAVTQSNASNVLPSDVPVSKPSAKLLPPRSYAAKLGKSAPSAPNFKVEPDKAFPRSKTAKTATVEAKPKLSVVTPKPIAAKKSAPAKKVSVARPTTLQQGMVQRKQVEAKTTPIESRPATLPPIVTAKKKTVAPAADKLSETKMSLPPIVRVKPGISKPSTVPPIVQGSKLDPAAAVSTSEIPLPLSVKTSLESRSASWPVNRK